MRGLFILLLFQTIGEAGSRLLNLPLPGPVIGMLLLLAALLLKGVHTRKKVPDDLQSSSNFLITNLGLLLVPAATGFGYYLMTIQDQILPVAAATVIGTVLAIIFTALLMNRLIGKSEDPGHE